MQTKIAVERLYHSESMDSVLVLASQDGIHVNNVAPLMARPADRQKQREKLVPKRNSSEALNCASGRQSKLDENHERRSKQEQARLRERQERQMHQLPLLQNQSNEQDRHIDDFNRRHSSLADRLESLENSLGQLFWGCFIAFILGWIFRDDLAEFMRRMFG